MGRKCSPIGLRTWKWLLFITLCTFAHYMYLIFMIDPTDKEEDRSLVNILAITNQRNKPTAEVEEGKHREKLLEMPDKTPARYANHSIKSIPKQWLQKIEARRHRVKEVCQKYNLSLKNNDSGPLFYHHDIRLLGNLLVEDQTRFLFCYVPKIANTNWKRMLLALAGALQTYNIRKVRARDVHYELAAKYIKPLNQYSAADRDNIMKNYKKALFLRNPFERLLSVYRNKIENNPYEHPEILSRVGNYVMTQYRNLKPGFPVRIERQRETITGTMPSGETFKADIKNIPDLFPNIDISFEEFLRYVSDHPDNYNNHWAPPYTTCFPCLLDYDVIGSFNSMSEDAENILRLLNADPALKFPPEDQGKIRTASVMDDYYKKIPKSILTPIEQIYRVDLEMWRFIDKH